MAKISFESEYLIVDWVSFNLEGLVDPRIIAGRLSKYFTPHVLIDGVPKILTSSNRPKGLENITDDFESRLTKQKALNQHESKLSRLHADDVKRVNRFKRMLHFLKPRPSRDVNLSKSGLPHKKTASVIKQEKIGSNVNSLGRLECRSPLFGMREKTIVSAAPTPNQFAADSVTGEIQNINIAFVAAM